jgi:putative membrane-bound dehydrogenase-like protein
MTSFSVLSRSASLAMVGVATLLTGGRLRAQSDLVAFNDLGLRVARGFRVTLYADSSLANDIYAMTLDSRGRVVVTSRGYIRTLVDADDDGIADSATDFATTVTGGMGLCFDGNDLYFTGDGSFSRFPDSNGDGVADGPAQRILPVGAGEHGGHAPRKGPDGWWYLIGGNDAGFDQRHVTIAASPIRKSQAGALLRVWPSPFQSEVITHGFRNPYDFDFNWMGDVFTYDSDVERDYFLPWYTPTRIYHAAHGGHHGWQLSGYLRSWNRPDYSVDTATMLAPVGRGSPTGVTVYRHYQFPARYRAGLFALDWTFGKVYFVPLEPDGATYAGAPEIFLEAIGNHGIAPTDVAVARDGSLLLCIGGRRTRGGVYRIEYTAAGNRAFYSSNWMYAAASVPEAVLAAPQPLDAWSRAWWVPRAQRVGAAPFVEAALSGRLPAAPRVRAIEILTELFGGLSAEVARGAAGADSAFVRARAAWSLGRLANPQFSNLIAPLTTDADALVRRCALEALLDRASEVTAERMREAAKGNLSHPDKRIRQLAATLASGLPDDAWQSFWREASKAAPQARLTAALALAWRGPLPQPLVTEEAIAVLRQSKTPGHQLEALRLIVLGLGDWRLTNASAEVYTAYETALDPADVNGLAEQIVAAITPILPSPDSSVAMEAARVLAIVKTRNPDLKSKLVTRLTEQSSPTADFHYLTVLSHLGGANPSNVVAKLAHAIVSLDRKLAGRQQRTKQSWTLRLAEVVERLVREDARVGEAILREPQFVRAAHVSLAKTLGPERYLPSARLFAQAAQRQASFEWSGPLIELLSALPIEEVRALFSKQWSNLALRDDLVLKLAEKPDVSDRDKFLMGLGSPQPSVVQACVRALTEIPKETTGRALLPAMRLLRRLINEPDQAQVRMDVVALINRETGEQFAIAEQGTDPDSLRRAYQPVFDWFRQKHARLVPYLYETEEDAAQWNLTLRAVNWKSGDARRGEQLFEQRGCQTCHASSTPLGPDLAGVADRLAPVDLFHAILFPNRDVAPPYRSTVFQTRKGQTHTGIIAFESADGVILQTGATTTVRLSADEIASRRPSTLSLMPTGLLAGLAPSQLADLYRYLKSLQPAPATQ